MALSDEPIPDWPGSGPVWLTRAQLARRWGVSTNTVIRLVQDGELTELRVGRAHRIALADVEAWEAAHRA